MPLRVACTRTGGRSIGGESRFIGECGWGWYGRTAPPHCYISVIFSALTTPDAMAAILAAARDFAMSMGDVAATLVRGRKSLIGKTLVQLPRSGKRVTTILKMGRH